MYVCMYVCICLSIYLSIYLSVCLSVCLSVNLFIYYISFLPAKVAAKSKKPYLCFLLVCTNENNNYTLPILTNKLKNILRTIEDEILKLFENISQLQFNDLTFLKK